MYIQTSKSQSDYTSDLCSMSVLQEDAVNYSLWFRGFLTYSQSICGPAIKQQRDQETIQWQRARLAEACEEWWYPEAVVLTVLQKGCSGWPHHQTATWMAFYPPASPVAAAQLIKNGLLLFLHANIHLLYWTHCGMTHLIHSSAI